MSVIQQEIPLQSFELVRDQIGAILADEIDAQHYMTQNPLFDLRVWVERFIPFDHKELPAVNVSLFGGSYEGQSVKQHDGVYKYLIECYTAAKTKDGEPGDALAMIRLHRLLGVCRSIIMDAKYLTLGFEKPFIMNRHFESLAIADPGRQDAVSVARGRLVLSVKVPETFDLKEVDTIYGYETRVRLHETDKGYVYIGIDEPDNGGFDYDVDFNL